MRKITTTGISIALIICVCGTVAMAAGTSNPNVTVKKFLSFIAHDDYDSAWKCVSDKSVMRTHPNMGFAYFEMVFSKPIFKEIAKGPVKRVENDTRAPSAKWVYIEYTQDGTKKQIGFCTVKEKGVWMVDPVTFRGNPPQ